MLEQSKPRAVAFVILDCALLLSLVPVCLLCVFAKGVLPFGHQMFSSLAVSVSPVGLRSRRGPTVNTSELKLKGDASGVTLCYLKLLLVCIFFSKLVVVFLFSLFVKKVVENKR